MTRRSAAQLALMGAWLWCGGGNLCPGTAIRSLRAPTVPAAPPMMLLRGGAADEYEMPIRYDGKTFGADSYVKEEMVKLGLLPSAAWGESDAEDFEKDEKEAAKRMEAAAKTMPLNATAEEAYAWHESYDREQAAAQQYRYEHAEEIERQEWEQAERDAEEETGCCGYGRFSGARNSQKSVPWYTYYTEHA